MLDIMRIEFDRRHAFYVDHTDAIHPICAYRLDRLCRGEPNVALPTLADREVRFAVFHVERFASPPRIVIQHYPRLPLDAHGRVDQLRLYDRLQLEVDSLESTNPTTPAPSNTPAPCTWTPDPITHRRLLSTLRDLRRPPWHPRSRHRQPTAA